MKYTYDNVKKILNIKLENEIDMSTCRSIRDVIDGYIIRYQPKVCVLDLKDVTFMDSSGIGLIIGRYNFTKLMDLKLFIANPSNSIKRILELSKIGKDVLISEEEYEQI